MWVKLLSGLMWFLANMQKGIGAITVWVGQQPLHVSPRRKQHGIVNCDCGQRCRQTFEKPLCPFFRQQLQS